VRRVGDAAAGLVAEPLVTDPPHPPP